MPPEEAAEGHGEDSELRSTNSSAPKSGERSESSQANISRVARKRHGGKLCDVQCIDANSQVVGVM